MRVVLMESAHPGESGQGTRNLIPVEWTKVSEAEREVAVRLWRVFKHEAVRRTVHRLETDGRIGVHVVRTRVHAPTNQSVVTRRHRTEAIHSTMLIVRCRRMGCCMSPALTGRRIVHTPSADNIKHVLRVVLPVSTRLPQTLVKHQRRRDLLVPLLPVNATNEADKGVEDSLAMRLHERTPGTQRMHEEERLRLPNEPVIPLRRLRHHLLPLCELGTRFKRDGVHPLQLLVLRVAQPVRPGRLCCVHASNHRRVAHVRTPAEIHKRPAPIQCHVIGCHCAGASCGLNAAEVVLFERIVCKHFPRNGKRHFHAHKCMLLLRDLHCNLRQLLEVVHVHRRHAAWEARLVKQAVGRHRRSIRKQQFLPVV
eukprot:Opistho-2@69906